MGWEGEGGEGRRHGGLVWGGFVLGPGVLLCGGFFVWGFRCYACFVGWRNARRCACEAHGVDCKTRSKIYKAERAVAYGSNLR